MMDRAVEFRPRHHLTKSAGVLPIAAKLNALAIQTKCYPTTASGHREGSLH